MQETFQVRRMRVELEDQAAAAVDFHRGEASRDPARNDRDDNE